MECYLLVLAALCSLALSFPHTLPPPVSLPSDSFQNFAAIHLTPPTAPPAAGVPIGFHIQLGHNATVPPGRTLQLGNYIGLKSGLVATGPLSFEAYNGSFCPPVTGYYYLGANVQLTTSLSQPGEGEGEEGPLVTISVCLAGSCSNDRIASLEAVSSTIGLQTLSVSGLFYLTVDDTVILRVGTNSVTKATIHHHTSFMGFLWGRRSTTE